MSEEKQTIYDFVVKDIKGNDYDMKQLKGKVVLIVNVASKCGNTKQYKDLQALYEKYKEQGFVILGFPCNQFGGQEKGTNEEIEKFCTTNYGVTFPMMSKICVKGKEEHPLYTYLKSQKPEWVKKGVTWNFQKFLVNKDSTKILKFDPKFPPMDLTKDIEEMLKE